MAAGLGFTDSKLSSASYYLPGQGFVTWKESRSMIGLVHATKGSRRHVLVLALATVTLVAGCGGGGGTAGAPSSPPVPAEAPSSPPVPAEAPSSPPVPAEAPSSPPVPAEAPSSPPVPAGFTTYQDPGYRFAYPQDWQRGSKTGALGEAIVTVRSGPRTDGVHCYGFASHQDNYNSDLVAAVRSLLDVTGDKTQQILQNKEVHVAGTKQGILVERTFDQTDRGTGMATPVHLFEVHYLTNSGAAVAFTIGGPQADVDACHVREIFDSFQLSS